MNDLQFAMQEDAIILFEMYLSFWLFESFWTLFCFFSLIFWVFIWDILKLFRWSLILFWFMMGLRLSEIRQNSHWDILRCPKKSLVEIPRQDGWEPLQSTSLRTYKKVWTRDRKKTGVDKVPSGFELIKAPQRNSNWSWSYGEIRVDLVSFKLFKYKIFASYLGNQFGTR